MATAMDVNRNEVDEPSKVEGIPAIPLPEPADPSTFPTLTFNLEEDANRADQLFSFRKASKEDPSTTRTYRPAEKQLLQEGKLGDSEFSARLERVVFGTHSASPACLITVGVNFCPKNRGWLRFRQATVEIAFEELDPSANRDVDPDNDEDYDSDEYDGPLVLDWYPKLIRGHVQTAAERYGIQLTAGVPTPVGQVAAATVGYDVRKPKEGLHLVQGVLVGSPEVRVRWVATENEVGRGGIYEQLKLAMVVRHAAGRGFAMTLRMKAVTFGGLPVSGKGGARIKFLAGKGDKHGRRMENQMAMPTLEGGSLQVGGQTWTGDAVPGGNCALEDVDLEALTGMKKALLKAQGPGAGGNTANGSEAEPLQAELAEFPGS
ncbi:MAG: hypothetical protein Q9187_004106 [Circinaria calcarea]